MLNPVMPNMHKKGEDVVNNFGKTLENATKRITQKIKVSDSSFRFSNLKRSTHLINSLQSDSRLVKARKTLRAPASGEMNDSNSQRYGRHSMIFQAELGEMAKRISEAIDIKQSGATKDQQSEINRSVNKANASKNKAIKAWKKMVDNGYDLSAADSLLKSTANEQLREAHEDAMKKIQKAMKSFPQRGKDICNSIHAELIACYNLSS